MIAAALYLVIGLGSFGMCWQDRKLQGRWIWVGYFGSGVLFLYGLGGLLPWGR